MRSINRKKIVRTVSLLLTAALSLPLGAVVRAEDAAEKTGTADRERDYSEYFDESGAFVIDDAESMEALTEYCSLDSRSEGLKVTLAKSITLSGEEFEPIPYFAGSFDGGGNTISGLFIDGGYSPAGLFGTVADGAVIKDLNVRGVVDPSGKRENAGGIVGDNSGLILRCTFTGTVQAKASVGGIAGLNRVNGGIYGCVSDGKITGESMTGGIVGRNDGSAVDCVNKAEVNTDSVDWTLKLDELEIGSIKDITTSKLLGSMNISSDTGGVAGYADGMLMSCRNEGNVGYSHIGYNVGGIVGRVSGYAANCVNSGKVDGRKDIGGVAGQFEPNITPDLSKDKLEKLKTQLNELGGLVDDTITDASDGSDKLLNGLTGVNSQLTGTKNSVKKLTDKAGQIADDTTSEINRVSAVATDAAGRLENISDSFTGVTEKVSEGLDSLETAVGELKEATALGASALRSLESAASDAYDAADRISSGADVVVSGIETLRSSINVNEKQARTALDTISSGTKELASSTEALASSIQAMARIFRDAGWTDDAVADIRALGDEISALGRELSAIHKALGDLSDAIIVDPDGFEKAVGDISAALDGIIEAASDFSAGADGVKNALGKIRDGLSKLVGSVGVDKDAANAAIKMISEGFNEYSEAQRAMNDAAKRAAEALPDAAFDPEARAAFEQALNDYRAEGEKAADSAKKIGEGLSGLYGSLTFTSPDPSEGVKLTLEGFDDLKASIGVIRDANTKLAESLKLLREGLGELYSSVSLKDTAKIRAALSRIKDSLGNIAAIITDIGNTIKDMSRTLDSMFIWGDNLAGAVSSAGSAIPGMASGIRRIAEGVDELRGSIDIDTGLSEKGLDMIIDGMKTILSADASLKSAINKIGEACGKFAEAGDKLGEASTTLGTAVNLFRQASDSMTGCFNELNELFAYLAGVEPVQAPAVGTELKSYSDSVYSSVTSLTNSLQRLVNDAKGVSGTLADDMRLINAKFGEIRDTLSEIFDTDRNVSISDVYNDVSEDETDTTTDGKLEKCENLGEIRGDLNVGGITGSMAVEFDLDPEDDLGGGSSVLNRAYETRAVLRDCVNRGPVVSKKDNVGGICGRMDLGMISRCESYGAVSSESGEYVGGIAGISSSKIKSSFVKCELSGSAYVGGVVGSGNTNDLTGSDVVVKDCHTLVSVSGVGGAAASFAGAISGSDKGTFTGNTFVSDTLRGLDRLSVDGKAQRVDYSEMLKLENLPEALKSFTLKFTADDEVLKSVTFSYGDSFGADIYPSLPAKDGCLAYWSIDTLEDLVFDTTVEAVYIGYTKSIPSTERRGERPIFFVEGDYSASDSLAALPMASDRSNFDLLADNYIDAAKEFFASFGRGELPPAYFARELLEQWKIEIPDESGNGSGTYTVRYLVPDGKTGLRLYIRENGGEWRRVDAETEGSYMKFSSDSREFELAVATTIAAWWVWCVIGALALIILIIICALAGKRRKRVKARAEQMRKLGMSDAEHADEAPSDQNGGK